MTLIHAIYENGVFRPCSPVALPEGCEVEFDPRVINDGNGVTEKARQRNYEIMSRGFDSGKPELAAKHDEHQP